MLKIEMRTGNAAFEDVRSHEVARILRAIAKRIESGYTDGPCMDGNGQKVGEWEMSDDE